LQTSCIHGGFFGTGEVGGAQAEALRIPQADGTLFVLPAGPDDALMPSLLTLSDVMGTGHHAARMARVDRGKKVAVVGDGAVGLCGVIAAKRLSAEQIIILGHHPDRIALAKAFGAILECVGAEQAMRTALNIVRPGGAIGRVGVPHYQGIPGTQEMFYDNISVGGGPAPVRAYIKELLPDVLGGKIEPGRVFDRVVGLDQVPDGYRAMNERKALKVMVKP
jgi:threonine dehydrogenase-like Zn-dependent dehydrogenase